MQDYRDLWDAYLRAYAPIAADERVKLLVQSVADEVRFTNPGGEGQTREGLIRHIEDFQAKMPGAAFSTEKLFMHHGEVLALWAMHKADGTRVAQGYNFVQFAPDGRIGYLAGFF